MKNLILFIIALALFISLFFISLIYTALDSVTDVLGRLAISIDIAGNVMLSRLFNDWLITKKGYQFGEQGQTISYVLGRNKEQGSLLFLGEKLTQLLHTIDKNHVEKAVEHYQNKHKQS